MGQIECSYALPSLQQHRFGNIDTNNAVGAGVTRQRYTGADADLKNATSNPFSGFDRYLAAAFKHRSEYQIVNRRPSRIGSCNGFFVEFAVHRLGSFLHSAPTPLLHWQFRGFSPSRHVPQVADELLGADIPRAIERKSAAGIAK